MQDLVTTKEAAQRLNLSSRTLEKLRLVGGGPEYVKLGRSVRYEVQSISDWVKARRRHSSSGADEASAS